MCTSISCTRCFEPAFHNTPKCLDQVEFRGVGGLESELDVVTRTVFSHDVCMVRSVIVKNQLDRRCGFTSGQRLTNLSDEGVEVGRFRRLSQQEERLRKMFAHRSDPMNMIPVFCALFKTSLTG